VSRRQAIYLFSICFAVAVAQLSHILIGRPRLPLLVGVLAGLAAGWWVNRSVAKEAERRARIIEALKAGPMSHSEVWRAVEGIGAGQVFAELQRLEEDGWITSEWRLSDPERPRRRFYWLVERQRP
jgi:hypothetical protein